MSGHRLAQVNVSRLLAPLDDPRLAPFVEALQPVNARADAAPGFVWRLQGEGGDATSIRAFPDPDVIVNLSVWESVEALEAFTFGDPAHRAVLRGRRAWFEPHAEADTALWWIPRDTLPSVEDAAKRLEHLRRHGPTGFAFTFRQRFAPGAATAS